MLVVAIDFSICIVEQFTLQIAPEIKFQIFLALVLVISALCLNIAKSGSKDESQAKLQRTKRCEANERRMGSANMKFSQ